MIKVKVIKPFYCGIGKELYLDEERYNELKEFGLVEKVNEINKTVIKDNKVEKATSDKTRVLSD